MTTITTTLQDDFGTKTVRLDSDGVMTFISQTDGAPDYALRKQLAGKALKQMRTALAADARKAWLLAFSFDTDLDAEKGPAILTLAQFEADLVDRVYDLVRSYEPSADEFADYARYFIENRWMAGKVVFLDAVPTDEQLAAMFDRFMATHEVC